MASFDQSDLAGFSLPMLQAGLDHSLNKCSGVDELIRAAGIFVSEWLPAEQGFDEVNDRLDDDRGANGSEEEDGVHGCL